MDDLSVLEAIKVKDKLIEYDVKAHIPSDVATGQKCLPPNTTSTHTYNNPISEWTTKNKMKLNTEKSNYMVLNKDREPFATRLTFDQVTLERKNKIIGLSVWLEETLKWDTNISEICKKAYPRIKMLSKLRFLGVSIED